MEIKIKNWRKYNPRADLKNPSWFRLNNDFLLEPDFFDLTIVEKMCWVYILSEASKKNTDKIKINLEIAAFALKSTKDQALGYVLKLEEIGVLTILTKVTRTDPVQEPYRSCTQSVLYERTNERDGHNEQQNTPCSMARAREEEDEKENCTKIHQLHATKNNDPSGDKEDDEKKTQTPYKKIIEIWNENRGELPKVIGAGTGRKKHIAARYKEIPDLTLWEKAVKVIAESPFHNGENQRRWRASFDYLVRQDVILKANEGQFGQRKTQDMRDKEKILDGIFEPQRMEGRSR